MMTTTIQSAVVDRLLAKGWIDPFPYGGVVYLYQAHPWHKKHRGVLVHDYFRKAIRVTKTGRILCG